MAVNWEAVDLREMLDALREVDWTKPPYVSARPPFSPTT